MCTSQLTRPPLTSVACGTPSSGGTSATVTTFVLTTQVQFTGVLSRAAVSMLQTSEAMRCPHACLASSLNLLPLRCLGEITSSSHTGWLSEPDSPMKRLQLRIVGSRVTT